jgi:hypothetical protein
MLKFCYQAEFSPPSKGENITTVITKPCIYDGKKCPVLLMIEVVFQKSSNIDTFSLRFVDGLCVSVL